MADISVFNLGDGIARNVKDASAVADISVFNLGDGTARNVKDASAVRSVKVNGVSQTVSSNAVDLDIESTLLKESTWTSLSSLWSTT